MEKINSGAISVLLAERMQRISQHLRRFDEAREEFRARLDALARLIEG